MSFFKRSKDDLTAELEVFEHRFPRYIEQGRLLLASILVAGREALPEMIRDRQASFVNSLAYRGELTTDEIIRQIDKVRADPLWERVTGTGSYALRMVEQFQNPSLSLFIDTLMYKVVADNFDEIAIISRGLNAVTQSMGRSLRLPDTPIYLLLSNRTEELRMLLGLRAEFMQVSLIQLDDGQEIEAAVALAKTKYLIVGEGESLFFINRDNGLRQALYGRLDLKRYLETQPKGLLLSSSFQEFEMGYPPEKLSVHADIKPLLDEGDKERMLRLQVLDQEFLRELESHRVSGIEKLHRSFNKRLHDLKFEVKDLDFVKNFADIFTMLSDFSPKQLSKLMHLWNSFTACTFDEKRLQQQTSIFEHYQAACFETLGPKRDLREHLHLMQVAKQDFDRIYDAKGEQMLSLLQDLISERVRGWDIDLHKLAEEIGGQIQAMEGLMREVGADVELYTTQIDAFRGQLASLSLATVLGERGFSSWTSLTQAIERKPLVLTAEHLLGLGYLIYNSPPFTLQLQKLDHLMRVINFIGQYQTTRQFEKIADSVSHRIDCIDGEMGVIVSASEVIAEMMEKYHLLQQEKLNLQMQLAYLNDCSEEFSNLSHADKMTKIPQIFAILSEQDASFLASLSHRVDGLYDLSQYPAAMYLGQSIPAELGANLAEFDASFARFRDNTRSEFIEPSPSRSHPSRF